jgi:F0F1-type ATP synthase delta subunit
MAPALTAKQLTHELLSTLEQFEAMHLLPELADRLQHEADRQEIITVITAEPLSAATHKQLQTALTKKWGDHEMQVTVDPSILSGLIAICGGEVIDWSGQGDLQNLRQHLT